MARLHLLATLAVTLLVALPAQAQEDAAFRCTFKAVFETIESDSPGKSSHEKQFVGHRMDVLITGQSTAKVIADVFTLTPQPADYVVSQRGSAEKRLGDVANGPGDGEHDRHPGAYPHLERAHPLHLCLGFHARGRHLREAELTERRTVTHPSRAR